ncbi:MAG: hypothetical protein K0R29_936 [Pseudobdellovibrio sp.]|nr:hypothetical protein [Pseudobdellovibrio sp.]
MDGDHSAAQLKILRARLNFKQANKRFVPHAPVRNKRPQRIFKSSRAVFLDEKVTDPCEQISDYQAEAQPLPFHRYYQHDQTDHRQGRTDVVKDTCSFFAVFI